MSRELSERAATLLRALVGLHIRDGQPVGSRTLGEESGLSLSPATIRNGMAELEDLGFLRSPHTSAGRIPTEVGLRLFVDGILQVGDLSPTEQAQIEAQCAGTDRTVS
ncbi:MAG: heat-inducible transcriptional repressor HrcA, partial [Pseudomonadota bacterium]